jgi:hypothetical protein
MLNLAATIHEFPHSRQITSLLSRCPCHFYSCSLENWNFSLQYDNSPSRILMLVLLANLIVVLHLHLIFPCIFFFNLNPRFQHVFLEKSWLAKSSARKVDMLYNFEKLCLQWQGFFTISVNLYRGFRSVIKLRWYQKFSARSSLVDFSRVIAR